MIIWDRRQVKISYRRREVSDGGKIQGTKNDRRMTRLPVYLRRIRRKEYLHKSWHRSLTWGLRKRKEWAGLDKLSYTRITLQSYVIRKMSDHLARWKKTLLTHIHGDNVAIIAKIHQHVRLGTGICTAHYVLCCHVLGGEMLRYRGEVHCGKTPKIRCLVIGPVWESRGTLLRKRRQQMHPFSFWTTKCTSI